MKKIWLRRLLLSYLPVFFIVSMILFLLFFQTLNEQNRSEALKANAFLTQQVDRFTENSLKSIDYRVVRDILTNADVKNFFSRKKEDVYANIQAVKAMDDLKFNYPMIDSVYFVRLTDGFVLGAGSSTISTFADEPFIRSYMKNGMTSKWTGQRDFKPFVNPKDKPVKVITLVRQAPYFTSEIQGLYVVNVSLDKLRHFIGQMYNADISFVRWIDSSGNNMLASGKQEPKTNEVFSSVTSAYTGWTTESGLVNGSVVKFAFTLYNIWMVGAVVVVLIGIIWLFYVTKRNYKPVQQLVSLIQTYSLKTQPAMKEDRNEFGFIQYALENLMEQKEQYQQKYKEHLIMQKKYRFQELLEGTTAINEQEWAAELLRYDLNVEGKSAIVHVGEIDGYAGFMRAYNEQDQSLLKFVVISVLQETAKNHEITVWAEWVEDNRLACIVWLPEDGRPEESNDKLLQAFGQWIEHNLSFTVTIGQGKMAQAAGELRESYELALQTLDYKPVIGINRIIEPMQVTRSDNEIQEFFKSIYLLTQSLRLSENEWKQHLDSFFGMLKAAYSPRKEIESLLQFLMQHLDREFLELSKEYRDVWKVALKEIKQIGTYWDTLEELHAAFERIFLTLTTEMQTLRDSRSNRSMIGDIRNFIEAHYDNPNLSLDFLSEKFQLSAKYLSKMFKEEFGENFVDFMIGLRINKAKQMLVETDAPIQDISQRIGYVNYKSFNRAFKNVVGLSPRDFRKQYRE